ncbi:MAG: type II toxin-antitoxin system VapC family toxin [Promethearchaeota archaeon]
MKVCIDTNVFISIQNQEPDSTSCEKILNLIEENSWQCWVSVITISEMLVGYNNQKNFSQAEQFLLLIEEKYNIQPISVQIAQVGAKFRSKFKLKLPDALILASGAHNKVGVLISNDILMQKKFPIQVLSVEKFIENYLTDEPGKEKKKK